MTKKTLDEKFQSSYGVDASVPDPVGSDRGGDSLRSADKGEGETAMPTLSKSEMITKVAKLMDTLHGPSLDSAFQHFMKLGQGGDDSQAHNLGTIKSDASDKAPMPKLKTVKEDIDAIFDGQDLSEEFRTKASTIFEAAVIARSIEFQQSLEEQYEEELSSGITEAVADLAAQVDKYLNHVAEQWMEENRLAVTSGIKGDVLESFMGGLQSLFTEHYIDIPEDKVDVVESLTAKVEDLEAKLNESENRFIDQQNQIAEMAQKSELQAAFDEVSEGLTDTQIDKLQTVAENISFTDVADYKAKLKTIVEGYVAKPAAPASTATALNEEVQIDAGNAKPAAPAVDPLIASFAKRHASKTSAK